MERRNPVFLSGQAIIGVAAVLIGGFLLLDNFNVLDASAYLRFWPLILVVFGGVRILTSPHAGGRFVGAVIALIGIIFFLRVVGFEYVGFRELWPLIIVLLGVSMLLGENARRKNLTDPGANPVAHSTINALAVLGGVQQSNNSQDFRGGALTVFMGACEIDLRQAFIQGEEAVVSAFAMWGGIKIKVPPTWNVIVEGVPFLGGFDDKSAKPADPSAKLFVVRGTAIMGGVEVTN
jgi:predicted membrane protein